MYFEQNQAYVLAIRDAESVWSCLGYALVDRLGSLSIDEIQRFGPMAVSRVRDYRFIKGQSQEDPP